MTPLQTVSKLPARTGVIRLRSVSTIIKCITSRNLTFLQSITHEVLVSRKLRNVNYSCFAERERERKEAEGPERSCSFRILNAERPLRPRHISAAAQ